ncbi:hypothetical protein D3C72_1663650 [compost metagenome]
MHRVGRALRIGQLGSARADDEERRFLLFGHLRHRKRGRGVGAGDQHVDAFLVQPFPGAGRGDVGAVLVVGHQHFDLLSRHRAAHVGHRHLDGLGAAGAVGIRRQARHVGD